MSLMVMLLVFMGTMWLLSLFARKQQQRATEEQARRTEEALVPGTWVRTTAGFYGKVVEADGDVVTLATPLGDETLWAKRAIVGAEEPPFASVEDVDQDEAVEADGTDGDLGDADGAAGDVKDAEGTEGVTEGAETAEGPDSSVGAEAPGHRDHADADAAEKP